LGVCLAGVVTLGVIVGYVNAPNLYRAECLLDCSVGACKTRADASGADLKDKKWTDKEFQMIVRAEWEGFKRKFPVHRMMNRIFGERIAESWGVIDVSNAVESCHMSMSNLPCGVVRIMAFSEDKDMAMSVTRLYVDAFEEYLEWIKELRHQKSIAVIRAKIEGARRNGKTIDPKWESELIEIKRVVETDSLKVLRREPLQVRSVGKNWLHNRVWDWRGTGMPSEAWLDYRDERNSKLGRVLIKWSDKAVER